MSWEVQKMKSGRLSFNGAICRNSLRRCWPLWVLYLGFLLLSFTIPIAENLRRLSWQLNADKVQELSYSILINGNGQLVASFFVAAIAVLILFFHLYNTRGNTLMNIVPVRRADVFVTLYGTGLLPLLLCQILAVLLTALLTARIGVPVRFYLQWLALAALPMITFYGFASFCAMLTGSMLIMPAVYVVLNLTAAVVEYCVRLCLKALVYGYSAPQSWLSFLSPIVTLLEKIKISYPAENALPVLQGMGFVVAYCAAGLLFSCFALQLYRNRRMEAVTDSVAIPVLKPIFRICMSAGSALVLACFVYENSNSQATISGTRAAVMITVLLLLGAVLGWLAAEMLIRRTVKIIPCPWKGLAAVCLVMLAGLLIAETDVTGYEKRIPASDEIASVEIASYDLTSLKEPENIEAFRQFHERLIQEKSAQESDYLCSTVWGVASTAEQPYAPDDQISSSWLEICYRLKNGQTLSRAYRYLFRAGDVDQPETTAGRLLQLLNSQEAIDGRMSVDLPLDEEHFRDFEIQQQTVEGDWLETQLSNEEFLDLWNNAIIPDAAEQKICLYTLCDTEKNLSEQTNLSIYVLLGPNPSRPVTNNPRYWNHTFRVFTYSDRTLAWIAEHTDLSWTTLDEVYSQGRQHEAVLPQRVG